ncbi:MULTISPECIES: hypothetical protein [unclassified Bartonella]|uniref:hypothetical protein n=1 Tax=unclassified Bartonella TaxID=2645622 RepID=UPI00235EF896|nr:MULTISPECIES: hypothetical protein [unclassified Bartonella]
MKERTKNTSHEPFLIQGLQQLLEARKSLGSYNVQRLITTSSSYELKSIIALRNSSSPVSIKTA